MSNVKGINERYSCWKNGLFLRGKEIGSAVVCKDLVGDTGKGSACLMERELDGW